MQTDRLTSIREDAEEFFRVSVEAADPERLLEDFFNLHPDIGSVQGRFVIIAIGKAAGKMMAISLRELPKKGNKTALVVTNEENPFDHIDVETIYGGHPLPNQRSLEAGLRIRQLVEYLGPQDRLLLLLSGGGSALQVCPRSGISLQELVSINKKLINSGANILEINTVRRAISQLKGGGLARIARPASVVSLILSDVPHDNIEFVASGPTVKPSKNKVNPIEVLKKYAIWSSLSSSTRLNVSNSIESSKEDPSNFDNVKNYLVGGNSISVEAAAMAAQKSYRVFRPFSWLDGDVEIAADALWNASNRVFEKSPGERNAIICGGETTVNVTGSGKGGRNQELALRFALKTKEKPLSGKWVFLSAGTDGRDGPTDSAGAIVDCTSIEKLRDVNIDPMRYLLENDSYYALQPINGLLKTGGTGTNVGDIQIVLQVPA